MAPGGTRRMAFSVLEAGADTVYVGVRGWSRRGSDTELTDAEVQDLCAAARAQGKHVRVVLNTMPSSTEVPLLLKKVDMYAGWGVTGFMISDIGSMVQVRSHFPDITIHVSVGAGLSNALEVKFYHELGASVVILPYRMGIEDVRSIKRSLDVGLEVFLFRTENLDGIVCPGKCTMSSYFSSNRWLDNEGKDYFYGSANRGGDCLRVCQVGWNATVDEHNLDGLIGLKGNPKLWLQELSDYIQAGVDYFKVPGRDRSDELVRDIVSFYRHVVDDLKRSPTDEVTARYDLELQELKKRWASERRKRDDRLVARAKG
jgi:putative protease